VKVLAICDQGGVSEFYRVGTPYRMLAEAGLIELVQDNGESATIIDHLHKFEAIVFSRPDSPEHSLILAYAKQAGLRVIVDIDDNLFLLPPSIGVYSAWHQRGSGKIMARLYYLKKNIKEADVLTVSTQRLGEQLCNGEPHSLRERNDFIVLPNQVVTADWREMPVAEGIEKAEDEVWVGWWGIYNHWDDWRDIAPYIEPEIVKRPHVKLALLGMPELAHLFPQLRQSGQLITGPFIEPGELAAYRSLVAMFDVALAPTSACPFNESKSDLKLLQYGAAGLPVIASTVTYGHWRDGAILARHPNTWGMRLAMLLDDLSVARELGAQLQAQVLSERTYEANFKRWLGALGVPEMPEQVAPPIPALDKVGNSEVVYG